MIKVNVARSNKDIKKIEISGHADSANKGQDLICAGVSSISIGLLNALDQICNGDSELICKDNQIMIKVLHNSSKIQDVLATGLIQLITMAERYPENIKITEV